MVATTALHWTLYCLHALARLSAAHWRMPDPVPLVAAAAVTGVLLALVVVGRRRAIALAGVAALFVTAAFAAFNSGNPQVEHGKLEVTAIDVGQGDSLLVISPEGRSMLIDAGGNIGPVRSEFDFGEDVVAPYLWWRGLDHLDVVVLTHAHSDHIGGMTRVLEDFHPAELWVGVNRDTPVMQRLYQVAAANHVQVRRHTAGDELEWAGTKVRVLSPPPDWQPRAKHENDDSLAMLISYRATSVLLLGDLEKTTERMVAKESPRADVLKVAHHGSGTSTIPELLEATQPRYAVISVGYHNIFRHPQEGVLERLQQSHVRTYRTDRFGAVTFLLDGKTVQPSVHAVEEKR
jgi:competence protein ComEC